MGLEKEGKRCEATQACNYGPFCGEWKWQSSSDRSGIQIEHCGPDVSWSQVTGSVEKAAGGLPQKSQSQHSIANIQSD